MTPESEPTITNSPRKLMRLLHRVAAVSTLLIICLTALSIYQVYKNYVINAAETAAVSISQSIVALQQHLLLHPVAGKGSQLLIDETELEELNRTLKNFLIPYDILKVKIFSTERVVIFSTDSSIIGQRDLGNQRLELALAGLSDANMQTKQEVYDLVDEKRFDVDVVETYVPIYNELEQVVGSFEIYQDMTKYRSQINLGVITSSGILAGILFTVFGLAYLMLRVATRQLEQTQQELHKIATVDALTGLLNRREIMRQSNIEFARYLRNREKTGDHHFSLVMADIDHFKSINDTFGHVAGDNILQQAAQRISGALREYNAVGRYGGEEFMITLPDSDLEAAKTVAERVRLAVKQDDIELGKQPSKLTLSLGVASALTDENDLEQVIKRADQALYQAKRNGRDQVASSDRQG